MHQGLAPRASRRSEAGTATVAFPPRRGLCPEQDRPTAGLGVLEEAQVLVHNHGIRLLRSRAVSAQGRVLLLALTAENHAEAAACFHHALDIARHQQAKSLELRAAMSLSRLWQRQGKRAEAHAAPGAVYGWFTEGFDTADLQEAKALLEALA